MTCLDLLTKIFQMVGIKEKFKYLDIVNNYKHLLDRIKTCLAVMDAKLNFSIDYCEIKTTTECGWLAVKI